MTEWQPVAWNSGTERRKAACAFSPTGVALGAGAVAGGAAGVDEEEAHQVRPHVAVGADGTLGTAGGARGVEDGGVVLGVDGQIGRRGRFVDRPQRQGERPFGHEPRPGGRLGDGQRRVGLGAVLVGDDDGAEVGQPGQDGADPFRPLRVDEDHLGARVLQAVTQFLAAPPRIERDDDGAGQRGGPEGHDPLRQVAHDDGHTVALCNAERVAQAVGQRAGDAVVLGEGRPLVLVDEEDGVAVTERHVNDGPQRRGCVLPRPGGHAADVQFLHLEKLARCGELRVGFGDGHGRRIIGAGAHPFSSPFGTARSKTAPR